MSERWSLGDYEFTINPNKYGEQLVVVGDNIRTLDGTLITQPTSVQENYELSSIFFQHRPRIVSEVGISKAKRVQFEGSKFYALDFETPTVKVYSSNLSTLLETRNLVDVDNGEDFIGFDVDGTTIWAVEKNINTFKMHKVTTSTKTVSTLDQAISGEVTGVKVIGSYTWVITSASKLYRLRTSDFSIVNYINLPFIPYSYLGYQGITAIGNYLVITYNNNETSGVYYIDTVTGNICNNFYLPTYREITDVSYDGKYYVFLLKQGDSMIYTTGNTVLLNLYELERQIKNYGFISMKDDMGVEKRVFITDYSINRQDGQIHKYSVDLSVSKVDRGVN